MHSTEHARQQFLSADLKRFKLFAHGSLSNHPIRIANAVRRAPSIQIEAHSIRFRVLVVIGSAHSFRDRFRLIGIVAASRTGAGNNTE